MSASSTIITSHMVWSPSLKFCRELFICAHLSPRGRTGRPVFRPRSVSRHLSQADKIYIPIRLFANKPPRIRIQNQNKSGRQFLPGHRRQSKTFKHQHPTSRETPNPKLQTMRATVLVIGIWIFSGAWGLDLGIFGQKLNPDHSRPPCQFV